MESLRQHAIVLDNASSTNRVARRANQAKQRKGGDKDKESKKDDKDVTDPTVFLNKEEYSKLTASQRKTRYERKEAAKVLKAAQNASRTVATGTSQPSPPVPNQVNSSPSGDAPSVLTAPTTSGPAGVLRHMMSNAGSVSQQSQGTTPSEVTINGVRYKAMHTRLTYKISQASQAPHGALVDGGANGGLAGSDIMVLEEILLPQQMLLALLVILYRSFPLYKLLLLLRLC